MTNLGNLLKYLLENKVNFVLIGGFAGVVHGSSLVTKDLDICALLSEEDVENFRKILGPLHPKHRMTPQKLSFLENPKGPQNMNNLYLDTDYGILDILTEVKGVGGFVEISKKAESIQLFGYPCKLISLDDLIRAKKAMDRDKDKLALRELNLIKDKRKKS